MKKYAILLLFFGVIFAFANPVFAVPGDVTADGKVDIADAIRGMQIINRADPVGQTINISADVNNDSKIGMVEVIFILQQIAGLRPATPSAPPTGVTATAGNGQVTVSWTAVTGATSYNIYWSNTAGVKKATGTKITGATSPYTHTSLTNGTTYYYVVAAVNGSGESAESAEVSATAQAPSYTVTYDGNGSTGGSVPTDSTNYEQRQTVTVLGNTGTLVQTGDTFAGWITEGGGPYNQGDTFTMGSENVTLFAKWNYNIVRKLTVGNSPSNYWLNMFGRVRDDLGKINCGIADEACAGYYDDGSSVTLTAHPLDGFDFLGWVGDDCNAFGTTNPITLVMNGPKNCTAKFNAPPGSTFTMSITCGPWIGEVFDNGIFEPHSLYCGQSVPIGDEKCVASFARGGQVSLHALPIISAPAGIAQWQCTSDDPLVDYVYYTGTAMIMPQFMKSKSCYVTWIPYEITP